MAGKVYFATAETSKTRKGLVQQMIEDDIRDFAKMREQVIGFYEG